MEKTILSGRMGQGAIDFDLEASAKGSDTPVSKENSKPDPAAPEISDPEERLKHLTVSDEPALGRSLAVRLQASDPTLGQEIVTETRALISPLVDSVLQDSRGQLDLSKVPAGNFQEFKKFLLDQVAVDGMAFNDWASESFHWKGTWDSYRRVLASPEFEPLLERLYAEFHPEAKVKSRLPDAELKYRLRYLSKELISVSTDRFASAHLDSKEGRERIRSILNDEAYDAQLRTDLIRSISRAKAEEGDCKLFVHNIRELTSTVDVVLFSLNVHNIGMKAGDLEAATQQTLSILRTLDESDAFKEKKQNRYLEHPEKVDLLAGVTVEELQAHAALAEVFEDQLATKSEKSDPRSKLRSKLAGLWLMAADRAHWGSTDIVASNETRAYLLQQSEQFLQRLYKVETGEEFQALSAEIRQFLKNPPPKADSALSLRIDAFLQEHLEIQTGLNDSIEDLVKGMGSAEREPFDALLKFSEEIWAAQEMGEVLHLERKAQAEEGEVLEAANQFIQGLEEAKRKLWHGYKQQGTVSRGLSQSAEAIGTEGAVAKIRAGNAAIDEVIAGAQKAKSPEDLKQAYSRLYEQLKDGGKLHQAFKAAEIDGTEQLIGLGQSMALTLAISAVTEGAGGVNVALKAISNAGKVSKAMKSVSTAAKVAKGFDHFKKVHKGLSLARSVQKAADAERVLSMGEKSFRGFKLGAKISTAENLSAKLSSQLQTEPQTILQWVKAAVATGASMALTAPLAEGAEAGQAAKPALKKLWQRYTKDLSQGALHLARDSALEVGEEVVDAYVNANLDGNNNGLSWDEFRDIATLCIAGGGAEKGLSNAMIGGGKRVLQHSNRTPAPLQIKAASKPSFALNPLFAPMWAALGAGGLGSGNPYRARLSIKVKDAAKDKPSTPEIDQALISLKSNHPNIRHGAISALEGMDAREAVNDLIEVMQNDPAPRLRLRAAIALGRLKAPDAVPTLMEALTNHSEEREKIHVAEALTQLGRAEGIDYLLEVLKHGPHAVQRFNAIEALRKMRVHVAGPALLQFVRKDRSVLRDHAILALAEIPWEAATSEILRIFRRDPSGRTQLHSAVALAKMGRQEPLLFLMRKAASSKDSLAERALAALGLAALGDPGAAPILRQILAEPKSVWDHGPYLMEEAIDAIAALQDREAIPDLQPLLSHPVRSISQAARRALQRLCGVESLQQIVSVEDRQELDWKFGDEWSLISSHLGRWMQVSILTKMHDEALRVKYLFFAILAALFGRRNAQLPPASIDQGGERNSIQPLTRELHESPGAIVLGNDRDAKIRGLLRSLEKPRDALERLAHLEPMVGDSPYRLRVADVAEQLVAMEAQEAIPELRRLAEDVESDPWLRLRAAEAEAQLAEISGEPSVRLLAKAPKDDGRLNAFAAPALIGWDAFAHDQPGLISLLSIGLFAAPMAMGVFSELAKRIEAALAEVEKLDFIKSKGESRSSLPKGIYRIAKSGILGVISPSPEPSHKVASVTEHADGYRVELKNLQDPDSTTLFAYTSQKPEFEEGDEVGIAGGGGGSVKEQLVGLDGRKERAIVSLSRFRSAVRAALEIIERNGMAGNYSFFARLCHRLYCKGLSKDRHPSPVTFLQLTGKRGDPEVISWIQGSSLLQRWKRVLDPIRARVAFKVAFEQVQRGGVRVSRQSLAILAHQVYCADLPEEEHPELNDFVKGAGALGSRDPADRGTPGLLNFRRIMLDDPEVSELLEQSSLIPRSKRSKQRWIVLDKSRARIALTEAIARIEREGVVKNYLDFSNLVHQIYCSGLPESQRTDSAAFYYKISREDSELGIDRLLKQTKLIQKRAGDAIKRESMKASQKETPITEMFPAMRLALEDLTEPVDKASTPKTIHFFIFEDPSPVVIARSSRASHEIVAIQMSPEGWKTELKHLDPWHDADFHPIFAYSLAAPFFGVGDRVQIVGREAPRKKAPRQSPQPLE